MKKRYIKGKKNHEDAFRGSRKRGRGRQREEEHASSLGFFSDPFGGETIEGILDGNPNGFAFLIREDLQKDIFIPSRCLNGAIHGDRVIVAIKSSPQKELSGEVIKILEGQNRIILGTFIKELSNRAYVIPEDKRISQGIAVRLSDSLNANTADKVLIKIISRTDGLRGKITRVFSPSENIDWDVFSVISSHNLVDEFSPSVMQEAECIEDKIQEEELQGRQDFREEVSVTIDGDDSRDFDDAVSVVKTNSGYRLTVHIADVAHYVKAGSAIDDEAYKRGTSVYFPNSFIPMLPEKLCNNLCSLMEGKDRLTLSVVMEIDGQGRVKRHKVFNGIINSSKRLTYSLVEKILDGDVDAALGNEFLIPMLNQMRELALILSKRRRERGAIDFDLPESLISFDETGRVTDVKRMPRLFSHRIIEEFMIITNETIAEKMCQLSAPFVYRGHLPPTPLKLESFTEFLEAIGLKWDRNEVVEPIDYSRLLKNLPTELSSIVNTMALRSMTKAVYLMNNKGHFGLASEFYCHFTAPIRRYPDLLIHRIIKDYLANGKKCFNKYQEFTSIASPHCSITERRADEAERDVEDIYKARFMREKIGEEFDGIISGVTEFGVFVQLGNTIEGLIKKESLAGGDYYFDPVLMSLSNMATTFRLGDSIRIKVFATSLNKIEFVPCS